MQAEGEIALRRAPVAREAVDDAALLPHLLFEQPGGIVVCLAGVYDDGLVQALGETDLLAEALPLEVPRGAVVVVVEAALADCDHRRIRAERFQLLEIVRGGVRGVRPRKGGREPALGIGELDRGFERLALRVGDCLHTAAPHQARHDRRVAVVAQPAGMDGRRHELVAEGVHREQRRHARGVAEVVVEGAFGQRRARRRLGSDEPHLVVGHERERDATQVRSATAAADDHVRARITGQRELLLRF